MSLHGSTNDIIFKKMPAKRGGLELKDGQILDCWSSDWEREELEWYSDAKLK